MKIILTVLLTCLFGIGAVGAERIHPPVIVLKLDDLKPLQGGVNPAWRKVDDLLAERNIKASYGIICDTLAQGNSTYIEWVKSLHNSGRVELWFHGWSHTPHSVDGVAYNEFAGWTYAEMKDLVDRSQTAAFEKLGFRFQTFGPTGTGAPGSMLDETALQALHDNPDIHTILYQRPSDELSKKFSHDGKLTFLDRVWAVNLESKAGVPDYELFAGGYAANPDRRYFVLQGHPGVWDQNRFNEFVKILDFLVSQNAVFMTPSECADFINP